jgi:hypothetical protein
MSKNPPLLFALVLATGCASSGRGTGPGAATRPPSIHDSGTTVDVTFTTSRDVVSEAVQATPEAAWEALPKAYADLGIPVQEVSESSHVLGNSHFVVSRRLGETPLSQYLECGSGLTGPFADRYRVEMLVRTSVVPAEAGAARVDTYVAASARNPEGSSNTGVACASTQRLEREIAERVRVHVGSSR